MAKTKISEFSATPGNNTDIDGINIAEGCAPSGINDAIRELMSQLKDFQAGTAGDSFNGPVGTTTAAAGAFTTLSASSTVSGTGFSNYLASPPAIGGTAAAAGSFTTLTTSSTVTHNGGTANGVAYLNGSKVLTTGSALTFDGTNMGLGTASPTSLGSSIPTLELKGAITSRTGGLRLRSSDNSVDAAYYAASSVLNFGSLSSTELAFLYGGSEQMRLTSTGLGIGTSSPSEKLAINGRMIALATGSGYTANPAGGVFGYYSAGTPTTYVQAPASGQIQFWGPSTAAWATLDSSGNLGLGVTPSAWSGFAAFQLLRGSVVGANTEIDFNHNAYYDGSSWRYIANGFATNHYQASGTYVWRTAASGTAGNAITFTQAMTLDASGNLLVGTTTANAKGYVYQGTAGSDTFWAENGSGNNVFRFKAASGFDNYFDFYAGTGSGSLIFRGAGTERARIDSSGNLLVGVTSTLGGTSIANSQVVGSQVLTVQKSNQVKDQNNNYYMQFNGSNGADGYINTNGSAVLVISDASDRRIKENIVDATYGLSTIIALRPVEYSRIGQTQRIKGFIAQEVKEVLPECVTIKDESKQGGFEDMHILEMQTMIPVLVKALQELKAEFDAYKATHP